MLKEQIGEAKGKVTNRRVIDGPNGVCVETSFEEQGTILGIAGKGMGTYMSEMRPDGTLYGEGQGVFMSATGEHGTWKGQGVGVFKEDGSLSFRGAVYYFSTSPKLERLNRVAAIYEHDVSADGETIGKVWEWV